VIILFAAYFTSRLVGKYKLGQLKNSNFEIIEVYRISTNKMLQLVKIGSKYVVLGISKDQITYITELEEDDVLFQEIREIDKQSFSQILQKFKGNKE
jgi:flagellar protein FliO/FliZ